MVHDMTRTLARKSRRPMILTEVTHHDVTDLHGHLHLISLPSTVSSSNNRQNLNVVTHVESIKSVVTTTIAIAYHILIEDNSNQSDTS